jgi:hypothetical protein
MALLAANAAVPGRNGESATTLISRTLAVLVPLLFALPSPAALVAGYLGIEYRDVTPEEANAFG